MDDDLRFLEDALYEIEIEKVMKDIERMKQEELCQILVIENEPSVVFYLYHENSLPAYLMAKVKAHIQGCYCCNEAYRDYCSLDEDIHIIGKSPEVTLSKEEIDQHKDALFRRLFGPDWQNKIGNDSDDKKD